MPRAASLATRHGFLIKLAAAAALIAVADVLFYLHGVGATLGAFALLWAAALWCVGGGVRRSRHARVAIGLAALYALVLIEAPSLLGWTLFWAAVSSAALLVRRPFDNAGDWALRLAGHVPAGLIQPLLDLLRIGRAGPRSVTRVMAVVEVAALPVLGGGLFLFLFAGANPVLGNLFAAIRLPSFAETLVRIVFWGIVFLAIWPSLRPARIVTRPRPLALDMPVVDAVPPASIPLSLLTFNAVFLLQNALDIAFLWSGAPLPGSITLADYAHRGAYLLIATALLAGLFVLAFLRPGSDTARRPLVRRLVILWVAQNILLVASSILRTWDYVEAYSLTLLRISALAWMALVGTGLILICWRLVAERSTRWLLNANALAALLVLSAAVTVDLSATVAWWNVRHSDRVGRGGNAIDLCYLHSLGSSALLPAIDLEKRAHGPRLQDSLAAIRADLLERLAADQADWHHWTWRGARRLAAARAALGRHPAAPGLAPNGRNCDGSPYVPPPPEVLPAENRTASTPLTNEAQQ